MADPVKVTADSEQQLLTDPISKLLWRYALPTVMSMLVTGIYVIVDGMFIGRYLGEQGLAGIMLAYPVGAMLYAMGSLIGMGSAALVSINLGQGNVAKARSLVGNAFTLALLTGVIFAVLGALFSRPILVVLGAQGEILQGAHNYLFWYFVLGIFPVLSLIFSTLLRNDGRPEFVTGVLILGGVLNIFLDWLLIVVWPFGLAGAAIATMLSQAVTALLCLQHFFSKRTQLAIDWVQMKLTLDNCLNIFRVGLPSFLMSLYLSIVLTLHNMAFLWVGGPIYVAAYSVVSYSESIFYLIFEGIAFGAQPILSFNAGAKRYDRVRQTRFIGFGVTVLVAVLGLLVIYLQPQWLVYLFAGDNPQLTPVAVEGLYLYFWGLPMEGLLLVGASFFQAINYSREASMLTASKLLLIGLMLWLMAALFGTTGVWMSLPITSSLLFVWMWVAVRRVDKDYL